MAGKFKCNEEQIKAMCILRDSNGMSYEKIGKVFGVSGETAKSYIVPEYRAIKAARDFANRQKRAEMAKGKENSIRQVTLAEIAKKAAKGKKIHGEIRNATIDDLATLNDMFNVSFTVYFD